MLVKYRKWIIEFCIFSVYLTFSISWVITGVLGPEIAKALDLSTQQSTNVSNVIVAAKIFGASFAGFLIYRFGIKWGYVLGCSLMSAAIFQNFVDGYYALLAVRFLVGLGSAVALVCLVPIAQKHFATSSPRTLSSIISLNISSNPLGTLVAAIFATSIVAFFSGKFEIALAFFGYVNLILLAIFAIFETDTPKKVAKQGEKNFSYLSALKHRVSWGMIFFYIGPVLLINFIGLHFFFYLKVEMVGEISPEEIALLSKFSLSAFSFPVIIAPYIAVYFKRYITYYVALPAIAIIAALIVHLLIRVDAQTVSFLALGGLSGFVVATLLLSGSVGFLFGLMVAYFFPLPTELKDGSSDKTSYITAIFWTFTFILLYLNSQFLSWTFDYYQTYRYGVHYLVFLLAVISPLAVFFLLTPSQFKDKK